MAFVTNMRYESDESIEEEDELDAELCRLLIDKLSIFNSKLPAGTEKSQEPALDEGKDP